MNKPLEKMLSMTDINEIAELLNHFLKKPVVIEDEHFSLLAYSSFNIDHFDEANQQTIFSKRWPIRILEKFMDNGIVDQLKTIPEPFRVGAMKEIGMNKRVVVSAKHHDHVLGYIWVQETDPTLVDVELDFLHKASEHVGKLLYHNKKTKMKKRKQQDEFFKKVMTDGYPIGKQIKSEAANVHIFLPDVFVINMFSLDQENDDLFEELEEKVRLFTNASPFPTYIFTDSFTVILLLGGGLSVRGRLTETANEIADMIAGQFDGRTIYAGISNEYDSVQKLRMAYFEALEVIRTAKFFGPDNRLPKAYQQLGVLRYMESIDRHHRKTNYQNEALLKLRGKDEESQTSLVATLEAFLIHNCRIKQTAQSLYIHPNTLKYRLKQITEITSIDFDDFQTNCLLYIELQLLKRNKP